MGVRADEDVDRILRYWPKQGYFALYRELTKHGEVCPRFNFFVAAATLGAVVNRRVCFQRGSKETFPPIFPNPWVILVAPQGQGHKSTALGVGRRLIESLPDYLRPMILASKITPEALVKALGSDENETVTAPGGIVTTVGRPAIGVAFASELGVLIGREKYNVGMITLLTDLYDCPDSWSSGTIMRGHVRLVNVCLSIIGASTPDWLQSMIPTDAFRGGFMSRLLLITMPFDWDKRVPLPTPPHPDIFPAILRELEKIAQTHGVMRFSEDAERFFCDWYMEFYSKRFLVPGPVAAYLERKQDHLIRLAMLLQLTLEPGNLELKRESLEQALAILDTIEEDTSAIVEYVATEPGMRQAQIILETLRRHKELPESTLLRLVWRSMSTPRQFNELVAMLVKARVIAVEMRGGEVWLTYLGSPPPSDDASSASSS